MHVVPAQQPPGQLAESQVAGVTQNPLLQTWPLPQATQSVAPLPHCAAGGGLTQVVPTQQPAAQLNESHVGIEVRHAPTRHVWSDAHV